MAQSLGTGRTPAGCLAQYQCQHKGEALLNSKWTPEEATRLATVIARLGTRDWQVIQQPLFPCPLAHPFIRIILTSPGEAAPYPRSNLYCTSMCDADESRA